MRYLFTFLMAAAAYSQSAGAPRLGFTAEGNQLLPVWGVPGAARLGEAIETGGATQLLVMNPVQELAVAVRNGETGVLELRDGSFVSLSSAAASRAVWSPSGRALALVVDGQVEVFVRSSGEWARITQAPGQPDTIAVSDDGRYLLARGGGELLLWHDGSSQVVAANVAAFSFAGPGNAFVFQSGEELVFANAQLHMKRVPFAGGGLLFAAANDVVTVRSAESGSTIDLWSASGDLVQTSQCSCQTERLSAAGNGWIRLHSGDGPLWMTDGKQVFFVPASVQEEN